MQSGTVVKEFAARGFFFIQPDEGDEQVFLHISQVKASGMNEPKIGDRVSFDIELGAKGPKAVDLCAV